MLLRIIPDPKLQMMYAVRWRWCLRSITKQQLFSNLHTTTHTAPSCVLMPDFPHPLIEGILIYIHCDHDSTRISGRNFFSITVRNELVLIARVGVSDMHVLADVLGHIILRYPPLLECPDH